MTVSQQWDHPRTCLYDHVEFKPKRPQDREAKFCTPNCRKNYYRYGARDSYRALAGRVEALEKEVRELRKLLDRNSRDVVTLEHSEKR